MDKESPDQKVRVCIRHGDSVTNDILTELSLPKRLTEPLEITFRPTQEQSRQIGWPFEFSVRGEIRDFSGQVRRLIQAEKVYYKSGGSTHWAEGVSESVIVGEPIDLKITEFLRIGVEGKKEQERVINRPIIETTLGSIPCCFALEV